MYFKEFLEDYEITKTWKQLFKDMEMLTNIIWLLKHHNNYVPKWAS